VSEWSDMFTRGQLFQ